MTNEPNELITALESVLDQEKDALILGELEKLTNYVSYKETLFEEINSVDTIEQVHLDRIHQKISRNQRLLSSALEGIRAVAERMANLRRVRQGLETYDQAGRKTCFDTVQHSNVEKRA